MLLFRRFFENSSVQKDPADGARLYSKCPTCTYRTKCRQALPTKGGDFVVAHFAVGSHSKMVLDYGLLRPSESQWEQALERQQWQSEAGLRSFCNLHLMPPNTTKKFKRNGRGMKAFFNYVYFHFSAFLRHREKGYGQGSARVWKGECCQYIPIAHAKNWTLLKHASALQLYAWRKPACECPQHKTTARNRKTQDFFVTFFYSPFIDQYTSLEYTTTGTKTA